MSLNKHWFLTACACLLLSFGACFDGDFVQGLACESNADCGPEFSCIEGLCGGPGELALCGNGLLDAGESCDDGNIEEGDSCTPECGIPACGDGFLGPGEACDDGNTVDGDGCPLTCGSCGNGLLDAAEACDDGNTAQGDQCTPECLFSVCGDGFVGEGETCDDANDDEYDECTTACTESPQPAILELNLAQVKQFEFSWQPTLGADFYQLLERANVGDEFVQVGDDIVGTSSTITVPLHFRANAGYQLRACNSLRCTPSDVLEVEGTLREAIGYFKASNTDTGDRFGFGLAISDDGTTLVVGAPSESSGAAGIDGDRDDDSVPEAGAVYVFVREGSSWAQQAYVKASNSAEDDWFGERIAVSADGNTMAVSATREDSCATGIDGEQDDDGCTDSGAVYVFAREGQSWSQQAYVKASNTGPNTRFGWKVVLSNDGDTLATIADDGPTSDTDPGHAFVYVRAGQSWSLQQTITGFLFSSGSNSFGDVALSGDGDTLAIGAGFNDDDFGSVEVYVRDAGTWAPQYALPAPSGHLDLFGCSVALSDDGHTLAVGARREDSAATGIDGNPDDISAEFAGSAYVFVRRDADWSQQAYVKASNTESNDQFGFVVALSGDGETLAVGAYGEDSAATGVDGDQDDDSANDAGAAYVFRRVGDSWSQQSYIKGSNTGGENAFGSRISLSEDGEIMAIGAPFEDYAATGIGAEPESAAWDSGAVYVY